jgi:outer membrane protein insertion porin family
MLHNYYTLGLQNGNYNLFSVKFVISRSSQDQMIYPRKGSAFSLGLRLTPPYSVFNNTDYSEVTYSERFRNIEFHKWTFSSAWYVSLIEKLVLALRADFGYLGAYNKDIGAPPFEKFDVGGSGLSGYNLYGTDVIALRGYEDGSITPTKVENMDGVLRETNNGNIYTRYFAELRYPFSLNPSATIYGLVFVEGGNAWGYWDDFNPFAVKRAAGLGIRAFLPMFGMLGIDWAYGFDPNNVNPYTPSKGQWHFVLGQQF